MHQFQNLRIIGLKIKLHYCSKDLIWSDLLHTDECGCILYRGIGVYELGQHWPFPTHHLFFPSSLTHRTAICPRKWYVQLKNCIFQLLLQLGMDRRLKPKYKLPDGALGNSFLPPLFSPWDTGVMLKVGSHLVTSRWTWAWKQYP